MPDDEHVIDAPNYIAAKYYVSYGAGGSYPDLYAKSKTELVDEVLRLRAARDAAIAELERRAEEARKARHGWAGPTWDALSAEMETNRAAARLLRGAKRLPHLKRLKPSDPPCEVCGMAWPDHHGHHA